MIDDLAVQLAEWRAGLQVEQPTIGNYRLIRDIGRGAFGRVFRAHDRVIDRDVALKLTRADGDERDFAEARALGAVSHDSVVRVYDLGVDGDFRFLAMELVEGVRLGDWLRAKPDTHQVLDVLHQIGGGLAAIHRAGLKHGDLKPDNIIVSAGRAKLIDLGLAPVDGPTGTPWWAAPEVLAGHPADHRSDQYSFARVVRWSLEQTGALWLGNRFTSRALKELPGDRWSTIEDGLRVLPRRSPAPTMLKTMGAALCAVAIWMWPAGHGAGCSLLPWVQPVAQLVDASEHAERGDCVGAWELHSQARAEMMEMSPSLTAETSARIAKLMASQCEGPVEMGLAAYTQLAAAEAFARAGDYDGASECRRIAAKLLRDAGDTRAAERLER